MTGTRRRRSAHPIPLTIAPTRERRQHDRIEQVSGQIVDVHGDIGAPYRVESLLARLERQGDIGLAERLAGEEFQRLFRVAWSDPLQAADMLQTIRSTSAHVQHGGEAARRRINAVLDMLGREDSLAVGCAWYVLGMQMSLREWSRRPRWTGQQHVSEHVAKGVLLVVLGLLEKHFRA